MSTNGSEELYARLNAFAGELDWGLLAVDYDTKPIENFDVFETQVRKEMLEIVKGTAQQDASARPDTAAESPFEDVSAERLMATLIDAFQVERFYTVGPFTLPEQHFSPPDSEPERISLHYTLPLA